MGLHAINHGQDQLFHFFFTFMSGVGVGKTNSWRLDSGMLGPIVTYSGIFLWAEFYAFSSLK